jgi:hypothetical protein
MWIVDKFIGAGNMRIGVNQFIDFAYGDKRQDKAKVFSIVSEPAAPYDPAKDRYKQFREAMTNYEEKRISLNDFLALHINVAANKSGGYRSLCKNYIDLKEDYGLIWEGRSSVEAAIGELQIATTWHLRTEENNQKRVIFLHFGKEPFAREKEKGILTVLRLAKPDAAGVGILNIQPGTLVTATRLDANEVTYLAQRAAKFMALAKDIEAGK